MPPASIIGEHTGIKRLVGVAKTSLEFEGELMKLGDLKVNLTTADDLEETGWELTGLNIRFEAYSPDQNIFVSQALNRSQR